MLCAAGNCRGRDPGCSIASVANLNCIEASSPDVLTATTNYLTSTGTRTCHMASTSASTARVTSIETSAGKTPATGSSGVTSVEASATGMNSGPVPANQGGADADGGK